MDERVVTLPEKMEIYRRDDQVILFNMCNMSFCRLHEEEYMVLTETLVGKNLKEVLQEISGEKRQRLMDLIFTLNRTGFLKQIQTSKEEILHDPIPDLATLYISLTRECNLHCPYCYAHGGEMAQSTMEFHRVLSLIEEASRLGVQKITFTGGEPLVYKGLFTLAHLVKDKGMNLELITNGTLFHKEMVHQLKIFDEIVVTLDGSTPEVHDSTRGEGTYYQVIEGIELLKEHGIALNVNTIINRNNVHDLYNTIELVGRMGIQQHNTNVHLPMGRGQEDGLECTEEEVREGRFQLGQALSENMDRDYILRRIQNSFPIPYLTRRGCGAATTEMYVNYDGILYPCRLLQFPDFVAGNLKESSLLELMEDSEVLYNCRRLYRVAIEECKECSIESFCRGGCRAMHYLYTGDPFVNSKRICDIVKEDLEMALWLKTDYLPSYYYKGEVSL